MTDAIFWYGCNMTRHGEVIRATTRILDAVGVAAAPQGGLSNGEDIVLRVAFKPTSTITQARR